MTMEIIERDKAGCQKFKPQDESQATYSQRRTPEQSELISSDFDTYDAEYFYNMVRCLQPPYPEVFIKCKTGKLIIEKVRYEL
jgi:methionyl-tRNA formyltransferase